jgi:hypothetical protein
MNNLDHISESLKNNFWVKILKLFDTDPGWKKFISGIKKSGSGSGMNNLDHISESLKNYFWIKILKFFDTDPGWKKIHIRDPRWKKLGSAINLPDPQH